MTGSGNLEGRFNTAASALGKRLYERLAPISGDVKRTVCEIRLRVNRPVMLYTAEGQLFLTSDSRAVKDMIPGKMLVTSQKDIFECFNSLCCYSVYSRQNEIKQGFITLKGGHRAGLCATAVYKNGEVYSLRDISGINVRIAREIFGCADRLMEYINRYDCGMLICGPPLCGKTTLLRDTARQLSTSGGKKTVIIDERGEIAGSYCGIQGNDIGLCDVLNGFSKTDGIMQAVRCLSPDYIICDEVGSSREAELLEQSLNAGVKVIASIHASNREELLKKPQGAALIRSGAFGRVVFLHDRKAPGEIKEIVKGEELLYAQGGRNNYDNYRRHVVGSNDFSKNNKQNNIF